MRKKVRRRYKLEPERIYSTEVNLCQTRVFLFQNYFVALTRLQTRPDNYFSALTKLEIQPGNYSAALAKLEKRPGNYFAALTKLEIRFQNSFVVLTKLEIGVQSRLFVGFRKKLAISFHHLQWVIETIYSC